MKLTLEPAPRRLAFPIWAMTIVGLWLASVAFFVLLRDSDGAPGLCLFRRVTGVPCPTCGATRAVLALGRGDARTAVALNPFVVIGLAVFGVVALIRLVFARQVTLHWRRRTRRAVLIVVGVLFVVNWAYVIWHEAR